MYKKVGIAKQLTIFIHFIIAKIPYFLFLCITIDEPLRCFYLAAGRCESLLLPFLLHHT